MLDESSHREEGNYQLCRHRPKFRKALYLSIFPCAMTRSILSISSHKEAKLKYFRKTRDLKTEAADEVFPPFICRDKLARH